jgi:hypothetical protein
MTRTVPRYVPWKRSPLRRQSPKQAKRLRKWARVTKAAIEAVGGVCQIHSPICTRTATQGHHKKPRRCKDDSPGNCIPTCAQCHVWAHAYPEWSYENGFMERQGPA